MIRMRKIRGETVSCRPETLIQNILLLAERFVVVIMLPLDQRDYCKTFSWKRPLASFLRSLKNKISFNEREVHLYRVCFPGILSLVLVLAIGQERLSL